MIRAKQAPGFERERTIVERQVQRLVRMVDDLLDVSRIARGKLEFQRTDVDLADAIANGVETAQSFRLAASTLTIDVPPGLIVNGDRTRLAQVMANMLANAAEYTNPGGPIAVSAHADGEVAAVSVRDNGIGIAPTLMPRVFEIFEQGACSSTARRAAWAWLVKSIVGLHGGTVTAESIEDQQGSEFRVARLPLWEADARSEVKPQEGGAPARARAASSSSMTTRMRPTCWISGSARSGMSPAARVTAAVRWRHWPHSCRRWHCWTSAFRNGRL